MNRRQPTLGAALAATLLAAYWAPAPQEDLAAPVVRAAAPDRPARPSPVAAAAGRVRQEPAVLKILPRNEEPDGAGVFPAVAWASPVALVRTPAPSPQPVTGAEAAAVPSAPPLPFRAIGRYVDAQGPVVFLQHNERNLVVRAGDVIGDHYKVESMDNGVLTLLYVPMNLRQTLDYGSPQGE